MTDGNPFAVRDDGNAAARLAASAARFFVPARVEGGRLVGMVWNPTLGRPVPVEVDPPPGVPPRVAAAEARVGRCLVASGGRRLLLWRS